MLKTAKIALLIAWGILRILLIRTPFAPHSSRVIRAWHAAVCRALGLKVVAHGQPLPGVLYASNHVSWIDIPVLGSQINGSRFLSKSEVRNWPLLGLLARRAGTLFIQRGNGQNEAIVQIAQGLSEGHSIILFPEATTTDGLSLRRFQPRLLQAVIDAGVPVQPIALRYLDADGQPNPRAAYTHADTFMDTLRRVVAEDGLHVEVYFLPPLQPNGVSRTQLAELAQTQVAQTLALPILSGREAQ